MDLETRSLAERCRKLEEKVAELEAYQKYRRHFLSFNDGEAVFRSKGGTGKIVLKADGSISISGSKIAIKSSGRTFIVADGDITMKGSKISQN